jgi:nucleotidyltransferase substrate binding protein (TIGR01987 family)
MSNSDEVRWQQRFENFCKALIKLKSACERDEYSELEQAGLIQTFEFCFELGWKTLKDLLFYEGFDAKSPRDVIRQAFEVEYLSENDTEIWLDALDKRNLFSHTYDEEIAGEAVKLITGSYLGVLLNAKTVLEEKKNQ